MNIKDDNSVGIADKFREAVKQVENKMATCRSNSSLKAKKVDNEVNKVDIDKL